MKKEKVARPFWREPGPVKTPKKVGSQPFLEGVGAGTINLYKRLPEAGLESFSEMPELRAGSR